MRLKLLLGMTVLLAGTCLSAQTPPVQNVYAIVDAKIEIGDGRVIDKGTVVLRDGMIEAVGPKVTVPLDAEVIKGEGLTVYPGFIDSYLSEGLTLPAAHPNQDAPPEITETAPASMREANRKGIRPELRAGEYLALTEAILATERQHGFTTAFVAAAEGTITGRGVLVNLSGRPLREATVRTDAAMLFHLAPTRGVDTGGGSGYPESLLGVFALTRQTLLDARYYRTLQTAFANGGSRRPPVDESLAALQPVLDGSLPAIFEADSENEIVRSLHFADAFGMRPILLGGSEAAKQTDLLAKMQVPVLLSLKFGEEPGTGTATGTPSPAVTPETRPAGPVTNPPQNPTVTTTQKPAAPPVQKPDNPQKEGEKSPLPPGNKNPEKSASPEKEPGEDDDPPPAVLADQKVRFEERVGTAATLAKAGIRFGFTGQMQARGDFMVNLRRAIGAGLPREAALRALTIDAARLWGIDKQMGSVEAGKAAALVVMNGDFARPGTQVKYLFIDRGKYEPKAGPEAGPMPHTANATPPAQTTDSPVELEADRKPRLVTHGSVLIRNATLLTVSRGILTESDLLIRNGKIAEIGKSLAAPPGVPVIDGTGKFVTPGIIDAHSHIALDAINENSDSITAEVFVGDVLDPKSVALYRGLSNGVTTSLLLHGSANAIGGQSLVIKMKYRRPVEELPVPDAPRMIKFALGENVKRPNRFPGEPARFPSTRMGVEAVYRRAFVEARRYRQAWDHYEAERAAHPNMLPPRRDLRLEALADILRGKIWVHCHSYRQDEMLMMLRLSQEFGFKLAALHHALEAYKIAPEIAAAHVGVSTFADEWSYKVEAFDAIPYNAALCTRAGIVTSLNSDNTSGAYRLNLEAAKAVKFGGLSDTEALRLITLNPAIQLGIDRRTGSLEPGKDGDIALWEGYPLSVYSKCAMTLVEGEVYFQRRDAFGVDAKAMISRGLTTAPRDYAPMPLPRPASAYALVGATIHPVSGPDIADGTLVIQNGAIVSVGKHGAIPQGAVVVNVHGLHLYPGLFDAGSELGLAEIGQVSATQDNAEEGVFQPDLLALTAVNPASEHFSVTRNEGVTEVLTRPSGALVSGQSAVIATAGWTPDLMSVKGKAALHLAFPEGVRGLGGFRSFLPPEVLQRLKDQERDQLQKLHDYFGRAKRYLAVRAGRSDQTDTDPALEAMAPYVEGRLPVIFQVSSAHGIRSAIAFAEEFGLKPIIAGGAEAWRLADVLAQKKIPVLYRLPIDNSLTSAAPTHDFDPYDTVWAAPGILFRAGVPLAFQSQSATLSKNLPTQVGMTCAYGLPHEAALKALSLGAAQILGVGDKLGSLEPGKLANLIVTDGDPLEITTHLRYLFIAGKPIALESKHTRLYATYRQRLEERIPTHISTAQRQTSPLSSH